MRKLFTLLILLLLWAGSSQAQVNNYAFAGSSGTYTAITGGTLLGGVANDDEYFVDPAVPAGGTTRNGVGFPIGFNFTFNGVVYDRVGINANGWVGLGQSALTPAVNMDLTSSYLPISSTSTVTPAQLQCKIAAQTRDLQAQTGSELRIQTTGTTPNQVCTIQWTGYKRYSSTGTGDVLNFQIILMENGNKVQFVYGAYTVGTTTSSDIELGLRGQTNADFHNRTTTTDWSATTKGAINTATMTLGTAIKPASGQTYTFTPPPPCASPAAQPTALILTPSTTSIAGSFTAAAGADQYLVVRSLSSSLSATPVNGTVYTLGSSLGGGTVDYFGTTPSFASTGLNTNTQYYYFIFATNNATCTGGPLYLTTTPLSGNTTTLQLFPINGTKYIGPTGDFFTLTAAFAYLNANGVNGPVNLVLQSTYVSTAEPAFPIPALFIPGASATFKVTVYPSATGLSITSNSTTGTLNLDGAKYVYFDGRVNATGTTKSLVIENSTTSGYAIQLVNGASYNGFQYSIVKGATTTQGIITFASTTGSSGNSNNLIDNCEVRDGVSSPLYAILSAGSASPSLYNNNNTVSNCLIHDFYAAAGGNPVGVYVSGGSAWTVSGNSFYMVNTMNPTVAVGFNVILMASGDGHSILNNYIGGSAPLCGGTPWTLNGNGTPPTIANFIYAIRFAGGLTVNPSTVSGNTVSNISLFTSPASSGAIEFVGLLSVVGIQNISNNVFGGATGTNAITVSVGNTAFTSTYEGIDFRGMYGNITNNVFGSFSISGAAGSTSTYALTVRPFGITPTVQNGIVSVSDNVAGSITTPNSIQTAAMAFPPVTFQGFFISSTGAGTMSVTDNTVANITNLSANTASYSLGIYSAGTGVPNVLDRNDIRDITTSSINTTTAGIASIVGIYSVNSVPGSVIRSNRIYSLTNTSATAAVGIEGMYLGNSAGSLLVERNFIHNIGLSSSSTSSQVHGIYAILAGAYGTIKNNMIQLGINPDGSPNTSSCGINGIYESSATIDSVLNNSIYIGGGPGAVATASTYAFNSVMTPSATAPRVCIANIFFNARSGGLTGKHYGIKIAGTTYAPIGVISNYNLIHANGATGGTFGYYNSADQATFAAYKGATGLEMASGNNNPNFLSPSTDYNNANLHVGSPTAIEGSGLALPNVLNDYDGATRSGLTPPDVGADAGNFTLWLDVFGPNITYVPMGNGTTVNRVLTNWATITDNVGVSGGASLPRLYYKKSTDNYAFVGNTSGDNGWKYVVASNAVSPYSFTIDYSIINGGSVAAGNIIQYFVVAQDAANNLSSSVLMAAASADPPVQNINANPLQANLQQYSIVSGTIPTTINVPGTYPTLTGAGGAFEAINAGVLIGNTTINITADLTEPGTNGLNAWAEDIPGANYTLLIKPDASVLRTISGTYTGATGLIRTNAASRFTIDGQAGKYLTFRNTNASAGTTAPTIQFNGGSQSCFLKNCTIENNGTTTTYGTVNIGSTGTNIVEISGNNIGDATGGTAGVQTTGIYNANALNSIKVLNNNIYNFKNYGLYFTTIADGAIITGNSFYYNSATASTAIQYGIYLVGSTNNHTISNNYIGGSAPLCSGTAWTNSSTNSTYGIYTTLGIVNRSTVSGNTVQNFNLTNTGAAAFYGIYVTAGVANVLNNVVGSSTVPTSIASLGTGSLYGIYLTLSLTAVNNVQGNTISGISYTNTAHTGTFYLLYLTGGRLNVGTTAPNIVGSNTTAGSISYAGTGTLYGIYCSSGSPSNAIENNIIGNITLAGTSGSPSFRGMYLYSSNTKKNKVFNIAVTNAALTPSIYGIYIYGAASVTNEYSNNLVSLNGGAATNPVLYGIYDNSYSTAFFNLYFNAINISGPATGTSSTYAYYRSVAAFYTINNNIFSNTRLAGGTGKHYAMYSSATGVLGSNYNDLYSLAGPLGYYSSADQTFTTWKAITGGDAQSQNVDPQFVSATDWHTVKPELNNAGIAIPAVTTDYSGATRGNPPDIGAYEFSLTPVITTTPATAILSTTATINGTVQANGENVVTSFDYGTSIAYGSSMAATPSPVTGATLTNISANLSSLAPATLYHFRAKGVANATTYNGLDLTFTTAAIPPTVVTTAATAVTYNTATLNGTVNANNSSSTVIFEYGLDLTYGASVPGVPSPVTGSTVTGVAANISSLLPNTLYHCRVVGTNVGGTSNGNDITFTTAPGPPTAVTTAATGVGASTATMNGIITANGSSTAVWFDYGTTIAYGTTVAGTPTPVNSGNTPVNVSATVSGLLVGSLYHYRVRGVNGVGTTNGNDMTFTTGCPTPAPAGTISGPAAVCKGGSGYVYSVPPITDASTYIWGLPAGFTITSGGGTNSITVSISMAAVSGNVTVYGQSTCGATGTSSSKAVTVNNLPAPTVAGASPVCQYTAHDYTTQAGKTGYIWSVSPDGTITATANPEVVNITWNTSGSKTVGVIYTEPSTGCTASAAGTLPVTVSAAPTPTISGINAMCVNSGSYFYTTQAGQSSYAWTITAGGIILNGQGTSQIEVIWTAPGIQTLTVNYANSNGCFGLTPGSLSIAVAPLPGPAGSISGSASVCAGALGVAYSVPAITDAQSYVWVLPAGATIASGYGTNAITVNFATNASSGNIIVNGNNLCGNGTASAPFAVTVSNLPGVPGTISGPASVCEGETGVAFSVPVITDATGYVWILPAGATIASGANTENITVDFAMGASSGDITVYGTNSCGNGPVSASFSLTVVPKPAAPVITLDLLTLTSSSAVGNQWYYNGTPISGATSQTHVVEYTGWYWDVVTINGCSSDTSNNLYVVVTGIDDPNASSMVIYPVPNNGFFKTTISTPVEQIFTIMVYNQLGEMIYESKDNRVKGKFEKNIDLRPVPSGIYTIILQSADQRIVRKIIVNK